MTRKKNCLVGKREFFPVVLICRRDLEPFIGKKALVLTDDEMELIARKTADGLYDEDFIDAVQYAFTTLGYTKSLGYKAKNKRR